MSCSEKRRSRKRGRRHVVPMIVAIMCLTAVFGIGSVTLAKYVSGEDSNWFQIKPEDFYFTSDLLKPGRSGDQTTTLYNWDKSQDYVFFMDIKNWVDDFRITPADICYQVIVKADGADGVVDMVDGNQTADHTYTIAGGMARTQNLVITVPAGQIPAGNQIKVTVKAKPAEGIGYSKTLTGTFELKEGAEICRAEATAHQAYIDLRVGVDKGQELKLTWPSWLTPDNTNVWLTSAMGAEGSITLADESSCRLRFFITGEPGTGDSFTVTEEGGTGVVHTIPAKQ